MAGTFFAMAAIIRATVVTLRATVYQYGMAAAMHAISATQGWSSRLWRRFFSDVARGSWHPALGRGPARGPARAARAHSVLGPHLSWHGLLVHHIELGN